MISSTKVLKSFTREYDDILLKYASELIRIDSSNPPGDEAAVAQYASEIMSAIGLDTRIYEMPGGHRNVVGISGSNSPRIALCGHLDTVPAGGGWSKQPFSSDIEGGALYGRGSTDMKGALAAMLTAAKFILDNKYEGAESFALVFTGDEEDCCKGAMELVRHTSFKPRAALIGEPTGLQVHTGSRGYSQYLIVSEGISCHAAQPEKGDNAIYKMSRALRHMAGYKDIASNRLHPKLGSASFNIGTIRGGTRVNVVPDYCDAEAEYRLLPGENANNIAKELSALAGEDAVVRIIQEHPGAYTSEDHPFVRTACTAVEKVLDRKAQVGAFPAFSEAGFFASGWGVPAILLGPGEIDLAHKVDEHVLINELTAAARIYALLICSDTLM
jgi:acetylornithine deacetylase/succinyl-diaminopimelate desuccinylase family protein